MSQSWDDEVREYQLGKEQSVDAAGWCFIGILVSAVIAAIVVFV